MVKMQGHWTLSRVGHEYEQRSLGEREMSRLDGVDALRRVGLGEIISILLINGSVEGLVEEGVHFIHLELSLEVGDVVVGKAVGAATGVGEAEVLINDFLARTSPVAEYCVSQK